MSNAATNEMWTDLDEVLAPTRERTIRHLRSVQRLMAKRDDLVGVVPMADLLHESILLTV